MNTEQLGKMLAADLKSAQAGDRAVTVHLFGIKYASEIGSAANDVAIAAGISAKYGTEIRKGMKLARFVSIKSA